jgi:1,4-alpha-glucan branching enzyme
MAYEDHHFIDTQKSVWNYSRFEGDDIDMFQKGLLARAYELFGAHKMRVRDTDGYYFSVWAPNADAVSVVGSFNGWKKTLHPLFPRLDHSGIWEGFIPGVEKGMQYKYHIAAPGGFEEDKADPFARYAELRPATASIAWEFDKYWHDGDWMQNRHKHNSLQAPWSVYEVHLGSWMRPDRHNESSFNSYTELAERLVSYVKAMNFTHVELMPVMEHPYDGSWGYQGTGYFAPTSRFGTPEAFMHLVDCFHTNGIGVILDWVPSHFPRDRHGLHYFDGAFTYEYGDMRKGYHPDWNSYIFNYNRGEVRSFLISSAHFWLSYYHADGLRVDAVNSIIRLDFSRQDGEWEPNAYGGNENLEAIQFLRDMNNILYKDFPDIQTIAEEASDWPGITLSTDKGGFGFGMKWMMGWMHDTFRYFKKDPQHRPSDQDQFSFSMMYFYDEKFMLPLSHDEVVHGKSPMLYKMPGDEFQKFANLRLLYTYMYTHPGAKLLFMGNEFGQTSEWNDKSELDWHLLQYPAHNNLQECVRKLNEMYRSHPALYELQFDPAGFEWASLNHREEGVIAYKRKAKNRKELLIILNMSSTDYPEFKLEIPGRSGWKVLFNSNDLAFWGNGNFVNTAVYSKSTDKKKRICEIKLAIPALSAMILE